MVSVASGGTADRMAARTLFKVLRAGSGTPARYSSTLFGAPFGFRVRTALAQFRFLHKAVLQKSFSSIQARAYGSSGWNGLRNSFVGRIMLVF